MPPIHDMSPYEKSALEAIQAWRNPPSSWWSDATNQAQVAWNDVTDLVHKIPGVDWTMENVVSGLLELVNEITQDSVWTDAVLKDFRSRGTHVETLDDIRSLDLEQVDAALRGLDTKYVSLATAEGAATGLAGAAGIVPDIVALVSINLRAAGEIATYCGFDMLDAEERVKALRVLDEVAKPGNNRKNVTLSPAIRTASRVARQQGTQILEQIGAGNAVESLLRRLGVNLTEKKLAQMVPVTGAFLGGGLNYLYTTSVCQTATNLYRERFLFEKYGAQQG
ncbi:MAG: EcsC family protein [Rhodothermales bacterium]